MGKTGFLDWESVAKSIGPLLSYSNLRTLAIKCGYYNEVANESIMNLLKCAVEKPKFERLILDATLPLSSIYELVNENFNLKSLTIDFNMKTPSEENIEDLIRILNCNNRLDEIGLGSYGLDFLRNNNRLQKIHPDEFNGITYLKSRFIRESRINRDDFAFMATILADFLAEVKAKPDDDSF